MEFTYAHVGLLQESMDGMSKKDCIDHLMYHFPHLDENWVRRNFKYLMGLDPEGLLKALHPDPTGNAAIRHVMKEMTTT
jgi:hypothetical protein